MSEMINFNLSCTFDFGARKSKKLEAAQSLIEDCLTNLVGDDTYSPLLESFDLEISETGKIIMEGVHSSNINYIGYSEKNELLQIEFNGGAVYRYNEVPSHVFEELRAAESKGKYFHKYIKGTYSYWKV